MRKIWLTIVATFLFTVFVGGSPVLANSHSAENTQAQVKLTVEQTNELAKIQKDLFKNKKALISKYVEYGVMTKEQGEKINSRLDERFKKMENNGFVPTWDKSKKCGKSKKGCSCH